MAELLLLHSHKTQPAGSGRPWPLCVAWQGSGRAFPVGDTPGPTGLLERVGLRSHRALCSLVCTCPRSGKHWSLSCFIQTVRQMHISALQMNE